MKKILFAVLFLPFFALAQKTIPRFENDTLFTSSGYKIYKGQMLQIGKGTGKNSKFRYISIKSDASYLSLANCSINVTELKNFGISKLGNGYIEIIGTTVFHDSSKGYIDIHMAFDKAIENSPELPSELIVPNEFRDNKSLSVADEINKLYKLYQNGIITRDEYDAQKKKLLGQ